MIAFKTDRIKDEFVSGELRDDLRLIVYAIAGFISQRFHRTITLTSIWRSQEENEALKSKSQTHPEWRAVDIRAAGYSEMDMEEVKSFVEGILDSNGMQIVCTYPHGTGSHFHVQVPRWKVSFR